MFGQIEVEATLEDATALDEGFVLCFKFDFTENDCDSFLV